MNTKGIKVSKHASSRMIQRYGLFMKAHEKSRPDLFILSMLESSYKNIQLDNCPFYKTKRKNCDVYMNGSLKFYIKNNTVVTVVFDKTRNWRI